MGRPLPGLMRVAAIIQARIGSERLPGKVLLDIAGETMLSRVVRRMARSELIDEIVIATSTNPADDAVVSAGSALGITVTRGSENDVLGRYGDAASVVGADVIVRASADSPFVDPEVCDLVVSSFMSADPPVDYASNKLEPSFPLGLDVEAFSRAALERAATEATEPFERAHVTVYIYSNPGRFMLLPIVAARNLHSWRWTVDTPEDLEFAREVFGRLGGRNDFSWRDVVALIEAEPALAEINSMVKPRAITEG
ncbi:MAG: cytidylyltransferase domain-containing protein [Gemmatimonadaceae bacterium]